LAEHERCVAIGETGLDFYRDTARRADQERAFEGQIALAAELGKPLIIHTRAAEEPTLQMLREHADGVTVILHCFSMPEHLDEVLDRDWIVSFAGNVTYPKNEALTEAVARVPAERLLVETDAPYLTPQPVRKHRNQPAYVVHTARFVAEQRGVSLEELDRDVSRTAARVFGWE
jgi:TatD DNase family protein